MPRNANLRAFGPSHNPPQAGTRYAKAVGRVAACLERGGIVKAYNALDREETSVGGWREAVDRGNRYAVIGKVRFLSTHSLVGAAMYFVDLVGTTRARAAAILTARNLEA